MTGSPCSEIVTLLSRSQKHEGIASWVYAIENTLFCLLPLRQFWDKKTRVRSFLCLRKTGSASPKLAIR